MTDKKELHTAGTGTASDNAFNKANSTTLDPLEDRFNLGKPARNRQQKPSWKRGNQRGRIDPVLFAQLALLAAIVLLIVGGLAHA